MPEGTPLRGPTRARYASNLIKEQALKNAPGVDPSASCQLTNSESRCQALHNLLANSPASLRGEDCGTPDGVRQDSYDTESEEASQLIHSLSMRLHRRPRFRHHVKNNPPIMAGLCERRRRSEGCNDRQFRTGLQVGSRTSTMLNEASSVPSPAVFASLLAEQLFRRPAPSS